MDSVAETPVKRRKTEDGYVPLQSQEDDFATQDTVALDDVQVKALNPVYETVPTLPVACAAPKTPPRRSQEDDDFATIPLSVKETPIQRPSSQLQSSYATQSTQLQPPFTVHARHSSPAGQSQSQSQHPAASASTVQVAASSPAGPELPKHILGLIANKMAPAGTSFRAPIPPRRPAPAPAVPKKRPQTIVDISSDDEVQYAGGSSGDEGFNRDLKPTLVKSTSNASSGVKSTQSSFGAGIDKFRHTNAPTAPSNHSFARDNIMDRAADPLASAYGNSSRPPRPPPQVKRQAGPAKAMPVKDMALFDITDYSVRTKVEEIGMILPDRSVKDRFDALLIKRYNKEDAIDYLFSNNKPSKPIPTSDDELQAHQGPRKNTAKLELKDRKTVAERQQERMAAAAARKASLPVSVSQNAVPRNAIDLTQQEDDEPAQPKRRRLIKRSEMKRAASPPTSPVVVAPIKPKARSETPDSLDDTDSEAENENEVDPMLEGSLLKFFNDCRVEDLIDMSSAKKPDAEYLLAQRPFRTMNEVRNVVREPALKPGAKRKGKAQPIGQRIVEVCETMWTGYDAVDALVQNCEMMGKPLVEEMGKWGVSVFGNASKDGELELVKFDDVESDGCPKDSGIGTPSSTAVSDEEGLNTKVQRKNRGKFFDQPASLAEGVVLKDYQVVGINWLALLYRKNMSCILADDMGLGKTCQVISFIAHLRETGVQGPHVIVVPSSVLENWLREFETFCPDLTVMPYHGSHLDRPTMAAEIESNPPDVVVTTYTLAKKHDDRKFLNRIKPTCCIYDEGHMLKNPESEQYKELMKIKSKFRLLLTGTPLQNNLSELIALLGFLMPDLFREHNEELQAIFKQKATTQDEQHQALLSAQRIARAKSMMTPFILRRKKHQVLKDIPAKHRRVDYCQMSESQGTKYNEIVDNYRDMIKRRREGQKITAKETSNIMMSLRKAAIHPLLFRRHYTDDLLRQLSKTCKKEPEFKASNVQ